MLYGEENHWLGNAMCCIAGKKIKGGGEIIKGYGTIYTPAMKVANIALLRQITISAIKMADFWKVCKRSKIHLNIAKFMTPWKPFKRSFIWNFCGTTNSMNMQMRVRLAKPLNFETAHGIFTKFHKKSQKTLPDIDKNWIDIGANTGQLAPKISSKSIKIFYHFYSSKTFQKIRVTNSALFSWGGNLVVSP